MVPQWTCLPLLLCVSCLSFAFFSFLFSFTIYPVPPCLVFHLSTLYSTSGHPVNRTQTRVSGWLDWSDSVVWQGEFLCFDETRREEKKKREKHYLTGFLRCIYTEVFSSHLISSPPSHQGPCVRDIHPIHQEGGEGEGADVMFRGDDRRGSSKSERELHIRQGSPITNVPEQTVGAKWSREL